MDYFDTRVGNDVDAADPLTSLLFENDADADLDDSKDDGRRTQKVRGLVTRAIKASDAAGVARRSATRRLDRTKDWGEQAFENLRARKDRIKRRTTAVTAFGLISIGLLIFLLGWAITYLVISDDDDDARNGRTFSKVVIGVISVAIVLFVLMQVVRVTGLLDRLGASVYDAVQRGRERTARKST